MKRKKPSKHIILPISKMPMLASTYIDISYGRHIFFIKFVSIISEIFEFNHASVHWYSKQIKGKVYVN